MSLFRKWELARRFYFNNSRNEKDRAREDLQTLKRIANYCKQVDNTLKMGRLTGNSLIKLTAITDVELLRILLPLKHVRRILNDIPSAKVSVRGTQEDAGHTLVAVDWHKAERPEVWGFDTEAIKRRAEVIRYGGNEMSAQAYADTKNRFSELAKGIEDDMIRRALQMVLDDALESETKEDLWIEKRWIGRRVG